MQHLPKEYVKIALTTEVFPNFGKTINSLIFGITNNIVITPKTIFVNAAAKIENHHVSGKNSNPPLSEIKMKMFVPIYHYCNMLRHIYPRFFKYINTFRMNRMVKFAYK